MDELIIESGLTPHLIIESQGKLYIKGWDKAEVRASASGKDKLSLTKKEETVNVRSLSNCEMRVPYESSLNIQVAQGEAILKSVTGQITIQKASAGLTLHDVGPTRIESVDRDLNAREVHGDLTVRQAARFVNASYIAGNFTGESISAHLNLKQVEGNISAHVLGNATLSLDPKPNQSATVEAHGVLTCRIPPNASATIQITGHGPITTKIGGETTTIHDTTHTLTLGDGSATLNLTAYGPVSVIEGDPSTTQADNYHFETDMDLEMDTLSQQISQQVQEQIEMQMGMFEAQMDALVDTAGISKEKAERIRTRTQEKLARAQEKIAKAQERASQKIEIARRKAERETERSAIRRSGYIPEAARMGVREGLAAAREAVSAAFGSAPKTTDPVSDEERMMILNMLAEKKISVEQAEILLAAIEGRQR